MGDQNAIAIIPARMGSTRFPGKALASETGTPLVVHVCERAAMARRVERVAVATDSDEIADAVRSAGFEPVMTGEHPNGTSRLAEAADRLGLDDATVVVNVQGDEPEIEPGVIDGAIEAEAHTPGTAVGTVATPIEDASNPNEVKAVLARPDPGASIGAALYFSRARIPFDRDGEGGDGGDGGVQRFRHVGIYAYGVGALRAYPSLAPTPLERAERLEQLRWLEHGYQIAVAIRESSHAGIDTPEQYAAFVGRWRASR